MPVFEWSAIYVLSVPEMDKTHEEFALLLNAVADGPDTELLARFDTFIAHTEEHFARENRWMQELGFPPDHCHMGEHERALKVLQAVRKRVAEADDFALGRRLIGELPLWFDNHASIMDAPLAHYLKEGGVPPEDAASCGGCG